MPSGFLAEPKESLLWLFSSVKWLRKHGSVGLGIFASEKAAGLFFASSAIIHLELICILFNLFPVFEFVHIFTFLRNNFVLDILCCGA